MKAIPGCMMGTNQRGRQSLTRQTLACINQPVLFPTCRQPDALPVATGNDSYCNAAVDAAVDAAVVLLMQLMMQLCCRTVVTHDHARCLGPHGVSRRAAALTTDPCCA